MNAIQKILKDERVDIISDERIMDDGFWVYLKNGFYGYEEGSHIIHEATPEECLELMDDVRPCKCDECK